MYIRKSSRLRWAGHIARMEKSRNAYRVSVGKPEGTRPFGRPRCRDNNIKTNLREVEFDPKDWIDLAQDREPMTGLFNPYSAKGLGYWLYATLHKLPGEVGYSFYLFLKS